MCIIRCVLCMDMWWCVCLSLRHGRCFWFSGQSWWDHSKAGVSEGGVVGMHGFWTVWRQDTAILSHTSSDGQTGLVPHGFRKRQLVWTDEGRGGDREIVERSFGRYSQVHSSCTKDANCHFTHVMHDSRSYVHTCMHLRTDYKYD